VDKAKISQFGGNQRIIYKGGVITSFCITQ
jgi:hypothetical protein